MLKKNRDRVISSVLSIDFANREQWMLRFWKMGFRLVNEDLEVKWKGLDENGMEWDLGGVYTSVFSF